MKKINIVKVVFITSIMTVSTVSNAEGIFSGIVKRITGVDYSDLARVRRPWTDSIDTRTLDVEKIDSVADRISNHIRAIDRELEELNLEIQRRTDAGEAVTTQTDRKEALERAKRFAEEDQQHVRALAQRAADRHGHTEITNRLTGEANGSSNGVPKFGTPEFETKFNEIFETVRVPSEVGESSLEKSIELIKALDREKGGVLTVAEAGSGKTFAYEALSYFAKNSDNPAFADFRETDFFILSINKLMLAFDNDVNKAAEFMIEVAKNKRAVVSIDEGKEFFQNEALVDKLKSIFSSPDVVAKLNINMVPDDYAELMTDLQHKRRYTPVFLGRLSENELRIISQIERDRWYHLTGVWISDSFLSKTIRLSEKQRELANPHVLITMINDIILEASYDLNKGRAYYNALNAKRVRVTGLIENLEARRSAGDSPELYGPHYITRMAELKNAEATAQAKIDSYWNDFNKTEDIRAERRTLIERKQVLDAQIKEVNETGVVSSIESPGAELVVIENRLVQISEELQQYPSLSHGQVDETHVRRAAEKSDISEDDITETLRPRNENDIVDKVIDAVPGVDRDVIRSVVRKFLEKRRISKELGEIPVITIVGKSASLNESIQRALANALYEADKNFSIIPGKRIQNPEAVNNYLGGNSGYLGSDSITDFEAVLRDSGANAWLGIRDIDEADSALLTRVGGLLTEKNFQRPVANAPKYNLENIGVGIQYEGLGDLTPNQLRTYQRFNTDQERSDFLKGLMIESLEAQGKRIDRDISDRMFVISVDQVVVKSESAVMSLKDKIAEAVRNRLRTLARNSEYGEFSVAVDDKALTFISRRINNKIANNEPVDPVAEASNMVTNLLVEGFEQAPPRFIEGDRILVTAEGRLRDRGLVANPEEWIETNRDAAVEHVHRNRSGVVELSKEAAEEAASEAEVDDLLDGALE